MNGFARHQRLRRLVSAIVVFTMAFSMVATPSGAAVPSTGNAVIASGGSNLTEFGDVTTAGNGLNGIASLEITGSIATRSRLEGARGLLTDATKLSACGVTVYNKFKVWYGGPGQAAVATTITGLTSTSTIGVLRQKIEAQVPNVMTSIEATANRLWLTAGQYGRCPLATTDVTGGVGPKIFGTGLVGQSDAFGNPLGVGAAKTFGRTFSGGVGYDGMYFGGGSPLALSVSFEASPSISYSVGEATPGTLVDGEFVDAADDAGLFTAVRLPAGYDIVLSTVGGTGIAQGTASVILSGGERDLAKPDFRIRQAANPVAVGQSTTITAVFSGMPYTGGAGGIDQVTFTLPDGFTPSGEGASARVGAAEASMVVDAGTRTITVSDFFATEDEPVIVSLASQVPTIAGEYAVTGTYRNFNSSATGSVAAFGRIKVVDLGLTVSASPALEGDTDYGYAMAGGDEAVTFTVKTNVPLAGETIVAAPATGLGVGSLDATTAVTDENGEATFTVRSDDPSLAGDATKYGRAFKQFTFTDEAKPALTASAYAHFYTYEIAPVAVSKYVAFADGEDAITYTFGAFNPVTYEPAPAGTRIYFMACGWDRQDTDLGPSSALTDAEGLVSTSIRRDEVTSLSATGTNGLSWVAAKLRDDFSDVTADGGPQGRVAGVQFMNYIAVPDGDITAQQSARGAAAHGDYVIRNAAGEVVEFAAFNGVVESTSTDVLKSSPLTGEVKDGRIRIAAEVKADETALVRAAGDVVQAALVGQATAVGAFGSTKPIIFGADMPINIVNNASVVGRGSVYLAKCQISGEGFKPGAPSVRAVQNGVSYTLTGTTIGVDLDGIARPQLFDMPVTMLKGTYDLVIDGITFPGALVVGDGIAIGVSKVVITMGASRGVYPNYSTRGSTVTLFGLVTTAANANIPTSIVNVYSSATSDGANPVFVGQVLTSNGQFGYRITTDKTRYYWATTEQNGQYLAGDSREVYGGPLLVGVKTSAKLRWLTAPVMARANRDFVVRGSLPLHPHDTTVVVRAYKLVGTRYVLKASYTTPVAAGNNSFSRTMKVTSRGKWMLAITHADYNHVSSASAYRAIIIK